MESDKKSKTKQFGGKKVSPDKEDKTIRVDNQDKTVLLDKGSNTVEKKLEKTAEIFDSESVFNSDIEENPDVMDMDSTGFPNLLDYRRPSISSSRDKVTFNRNFLKDAGPLSFKDFLMAIREEIPPLISGIPEFDNITSFSPSSISSFCGESGEGKTITLLNFMFNMSDIYRDLHFIFYSYGTKKLNIEKMLINIAGSTSFSIKDDFIKKIIGDNSSLSNLEIWEKLFKNHSEDEMISLAKKRKDMNGLNSFLQMSSRIHIIDRCYDIQGLLKSIELFDTSHLKIGAVFIDSLHLIPGDIFYYSSYESLIKHLSDYLKTDSFKRNFPFLISCIDSKSIKKNLMEISSNFISLKKSEKEKDFLIMNFEKSLFKKNYEMKLELDPKLFKIT